MIEEVTLTAATNGAVFADPRGAFSAVREGFRRMPDDVPLALVGRRLGMMAQAGHVPRMLDRGEAEAAWPAVGEFVGAAASAVFLLNRPASVGGDLTERTIGYALALAGFADPALAEAAQE